VLFFLLASLLAGLIVVSPHGLLIAQEVSATPTEIPFNELPECPPFTLEALTPTPIPDFSATAPRCRVNSTLIVDVRALIEQGIDPRTVGIGGDPVFSDESTPSPFATPTIPSVTFVERVTTPLAADAPHQMNRVCLPAVQGGPSFELSASATRTISLPDSDSSEPSNKLYMPLLQGTLSSSAESADAEIAAP
jgi:hypothetical protein